LHVRFFSAVGQYFSPISLLSCPPWWRLIAIISPELTALTPLFRISGSASGKAFFLAPKLHLAVERYLSHLSRPWVVVTSLWIENWSLNEIKRPHVLPVCFAPWAWWAGYLNERLFVPLLQDIQENVNLSKDAIGLTLGMLISDDMVFRYVILHMVQGRISVFIIYSTTLSMYMAIMLLILLLLINKFTYGSVWLWNLVCDIKGGT
jgi:hypothetical protein